MSGLVRLIVEDLAGSVRELLEARARRRELERDRALRTRIETTFRELAERGDLIAARAAAGAARVEANMAALRPCSDAQCAKRLGHEGPHQRGDLAWGP